MCRIARKSVPIHIIVHYPRTEEDKRELARRAAEVHADTVKEYIQKLNCSSDQKLKLLNAIIETVSDEEKGV